jgi:hypothetical protein
MDFQNRETRDYTFYDTFLGGMGIEWSLQNYPLEIRHWKFFGPKIIHASQHNIIQMIRVMGLGEARHLS